MEDDDDEEMMMNNQSYMQDHDSYHYLTSQSAQFSNDHISLDFNVGYYDEFDKMKNVVLNMRGSANLRSNTHLTVRDEYGNCLKMRLVGSTFILTQLGECPTKYFGNSSDSNPGCILLERGLFEVEAKSPQPFVYSQNLKLVVSKISKKTSRNIAKYITFLFEIENLGYIVLSFGHRKCMRTSVVFATSVFVSKFVSRDCPNGIDTVNTNEARNSTHIDGPTRNRSASQPQQRKRSAATPKPLISLHAASKSLTELSTSTSTIIDNQQNPQTPQSCGSNGSSPFPTQFLNTNAYSSSTHMIGSPLMPLSPSTTTTSIGSISPRFNQLNNSSSTVNTPRYLQNYPSEFSSPSSYQSSNFGQKNSSVSSSTSYCTSGNFASSVLSHPSTTSLLFDSNDRILGNSSSPRQHYLSDQYSSEFVINSNNTSPNPSPRLRTSFSSTPQSNSLYSPSTPNFPNQFDQQYNMQQYNTPPFECSTLSCEFNEAGICTIINNHPEGFSRNDKISVLFIACEPQDVQIENGLVIEVTSKLLVFRVPVIPLSLCQLPQIRAKLFLKINGRLMFLDYFTFKNGEYDFAFRPLHNMMYQKTSPSNSQVLNALFQNNQFN
ncbi:predicted protein [Naegleria gruberi]|uniref:Predicted protein n=1 Tax=Naegleria gruberi TaxID=5762 RepID=D2VZ37_NAEGR|nr:uncharacterized protein NAEGRDRAFT_81785 [Naegleria gruberi]EFC37923.1 predicted protein [Naegleria gruberi]|eukprot:XP_002670667.1 predicted protein [Naegleria gruberi strain NEG-M]